VLVSFISFFLIQTLTTRHNMLQWIFVLSMLIVEMLVCLAVIIPIPISFRRRLLVFLARVWNKNPAARIVIKSMMGLCAGLLVDSVRSIVKVEQVQLDQPELANKLFAGQIPELNIRLFSSERNLFLTGFTLFLFLMLYRFMSMANQLIELETTLELSDEKAMVQQKDTQKLRGEVDLLNKTLDEHGVNRELSLYQVNIIHVGEVTLPHSPLFHVHQSPRELIAIEVRVVVEIRKNGGITVP